MNKTASHTFIPQLLGFLFLLGSFFGLLFLLKNPDTKISASDPSQTQMVTKPKPHHAPAKTAWPAPAPEPEKAEDFYQKALIAARDAGDDDSARRWLEAALREKPDHIEAADALYANYARRQDWEGALDAFQKLESETTGAASAALDYGWGRLYLELGHPDQARLRLEAALEAKADNPLIREQLAFVYDQLGERDWARREWQSLAQDESAGRASWNAKIRLAEDLFAEGRWAEAEAYAKEILKQDPQNRLGSLLSEH